MKSTVHPVLFTVALLFVSACSVNQSKDSIDTPRKHSDYSLIAENLVNVLGSIESINRIDTTFQMIEPSTPIGRAVLKAVQDQGYGVQIVSGDLGDNFLRYKAELSQTESGLLEIYSLSAGNHEVHRQYTIIDGKTTPTSPVTVKTDSVISGELDDSLFGVLLERSVSSVIEINSSATEVLVYAEKNKDIRDLNAPLRNVRRIEASNFESVFEQYDDLVRKNLTFANDSLVLGSKNKNILVKLAKEVNPETDIVSVIGCSHGRTSFDNGNQLLAEGRAQRVTESLMFAGLDPELIFDEACWDSEYFDEQAPRRGVMVTHKRLRNRG